MRVGVGRPGGGLGSNFGAGGDRGGGQGRYWIALTALWATESVLQRARRAFGYLGGAGVWGRGVGPGSPPKPGSAKIAAMVAK